jgi:dephospho-CoA kinase
MSEPARKRPYVVALTGGIASGKSTVSGLFRELGVPVVDADEIARELVEPGQPLLSSIVGALGQELLDAYGRLKRRKLREMIFSSPQVRAELEAITHPRILEEAERQVFEVTAPYCILVIPLLAEIGGRETVDRVLVVDAETETRVQRVMDRDEMSREEVNAALAAQASQEARLAIADDVLDNSGDLASLPERVAALHRQYLELAEEWRRSQDEPDSIPIG